jgi:L-arabinonolactonase
MFEWEIIDKESCFCGEKPFFDHLENRLLWIDSGAAAVYCLHFENNRKTSITVPFPLEGLVPRSNTGWAAPTQKSILLFDNNFLMEKQIDHTCMEEKKLAFHECTVSSDGALYIGSYDTEDYTASNGIIFRFSADHELEPVIHDLALPNGTGFSGDGKTFYVNEMMASRILAFDYDPEKGKFSNRRIFCTISPEEGYPDGMAMDNEGSLWIALWQGFKVIKINQEGKRTGTFEAPVPSPTCPVFGGKKMDMLYVTSARKGLSEQQLKNYPSSGMLFRFQTKNNGRAPWAFSG